MTIGLDSGGVITRWTDEMKEFIKVLQDGGADIYVVSHNVDPLLPQEDLRNRYDFLNVDEVYTNENDVDKVEWKKEMCEKLDIDIFVDDQEVIVKGLQKAGVIAWHAIQ